MNKLNLLCLGFLLIIVSCTSIEPASVEAKDDQINVIDENQKFSKYHMVLLTCESVLKIY